MPSECQLFGLDFDCFWRDFDYQNSAFLRMQSQCRLLTVNLPLFWAEPVRLDRQPLTSENGRGLALPLARRCFAKAPPLTLPYHQNNAVE